jgi:2-dehydropantoate 2-reductase
MNEIKIAIVGPGSVGSFIAYVLNKQGLKPYLVFKDSDKARKVIKKGGIRFKVGTAVERIWGHYVTYEEIDNNIDLVFVTTKAYDFTRAFNSILQKLSNNGIMVVCQNGLGPFEEAINILGKERVIALVINAGITRIDDITYELRGLGISYVGGREAEVVHLEDIYEWFKGFSFKLVDDIEPYRWLKLLVNAGINPVTALLRKPNEVIITNKWAKLLAMDLIKEGWDIAVLRNVSLPEDPIKAMFKVAKSTGHNYSSMLQDILRGKRTEIDYINGAIVKLAKDYDVDVPINSVIYRLIKSLEPS